MFLHFQQIIDGLLLWWFRTKLYFFKKIKNISQSNFAITTFLFFSKIHDFFESNIALRGNVISSWKDVLRLNTGHKFYFILLIFTQTAFINWHKKSLKCKNSVFHEFYEISHSKSCLSTRGGTSDYPTKIDFYKKLFLCNLPSDRFRIL